MQLQKAQGQVGATEEFPQNLLFLVKSHPGDRVVPPAPAAQCHRVPLQQRPCWHLQHQRLCGTGGSRHTEEPQTGPKWVLTALGTSGWSVHCTGGSHGHQEQPGGTAVTTGVPPHWDALGCPGMSLCAGDRLSPYEGCEGTHGLEPTQTCQGTTLSISDPRSPFDTITEVLIPLPGL